MLIILNFNENYDLATTQINARNVGHKKTLRDNIC